MSNRNHMICPTCGHDFYVDAAYGTCDACQTMFYAAQSRTSKPRKPAERHADCRSHPCSPQCPHVERYHPRP